MAKHGDLITDGGVTWKVVDTRVHGYVAETPNFYSRSELFSVSSLPAVYITTPDRLLININGHGYIATSSTINLDSTSSWDSNDVGYSVRTTRVGKDFYIYACEQEGDVPKWVISSNSTCPTGYTENNSRKVGGFHCLCADVGTIEGHPLSGYLEGMVLPLSIWDLLHRPISEPEGMVWVKGINKWVDIYLASWNGDADSGELVSVFGGATASGSQQNVQVWNGEKFAEIFPLIGKQLPMRDDFVVFAKGSNEGTSVAGGGKVYTGGWTDTAGRRMISNYGIEDCCGFKFQYTGNVAYGSSSKITTLYNKNVDSRSYGASYYCSLKRMLVGGTHSNNGSGSVCGSRCACQDTSYVTGRIARGVSEPRRFEWH